MRTISIRSEEGLLILEYSPDQDPSWVMRQLDQRREVAIRRTFYFTAIDLLTDGPEEGEETAPLPEDNFHFVLGRLEGEFFRIPGKKLGINDDVLIRKDFRIDPKHFMAPRKVSIFRQVSKLVAGEIRIGGSEEGSIPGEVFNALVERFPNEVELSKYVQARISSVLREYLETTTDAESSYHAYRNKREAASGRGWAHSFDLQEREKFEAILSRLIDMLRREDDFSEKQWQVEIKDIICLVYPKYLMAFREAPIRDSHRKKDRSVDFLLMDHDGNVDGLEIKKPFGNAVISERTYRDNHVPMRELSGSVIQMEKYLYHLVRSGEAGIAALNKRYAKELPAGIQIKVTNPCGMLLIGRDKGLSEEQRLDFEVIKRHYRNVVDIVTYDDLLRRLGAKIEALGGTPAIGSVDSTDRAD